MTSRPLVALQVLAMLAMCSGGAFACKRSDGASAQQAAQSLEGIQPGEERSMGDGVYFRMHRIQAEAPLGDGWHRATSTEGGFSVELPLAFNDFRMRAAAEDGIEMRTHSVGAKSAGLLAWSASCMVRKDKKVLTPTNDVIEARGDPVKAYQRTALLDDGVVCVLIVEAQGSDPLPPEADRLRFLRSLTRTGAPTW